MLRALAPHFGRALDASTVTRSDCDAVADSVGVLVASGDGRMVSADPQARQLLVEMMDQPLTDAALSQLRQDRLPDFLSDFLRRHAHCAGADVTLERRSRWGVYRARTFPQTAGDALSAPSTHAILLSRHLPHTVRIMRAVEQLDLSPRERQTAFHLASGADAALGAAALGVSISTWRSYVKRLYQRLDINDRFALIGRLQ